MDEARTILTTSNWTHTLQTILDPRHAQRTILAPTSETRRTLRDILTVLREAHRRLSVADDDELDAATATANIDEPSGDYSNDEYGDNDVIEVETERGVGGMVDYGADDEDTDSATATANIDEPWDDYDDNDYGENDLIEEEDAERGFGGMVDYGDAYRDGGFGGSPVSAAATADRIKKCKYHQMGGGGGDDEGGAGQKTAAVGCMVCIEDFEAGDDLGVLPCSHTFHHGCLVKWLARSRLCPCCRYALPSEAQTRP